MLVKWAPGQQRWSKISDKQRHIDENMCNFLVSTVPVDDLVPLLYVLFFKIAIRSNASHAKKNQ